MTATATATATMTTTAGTGAIGAEPLEWVAMPHHHPLALGLALLLASALASTLALAPADADAPPDELRVDDDAAVARALDDLDHARFARRAAATRALHDVGPPIIPILERFTTVAQTPEARARARAIIAAISRRLHWESFKGGDIVGGLQLTLRCDRSSYRAGQRIRLRIELDNRADEAKQALALTYLDVKLPSGESTRSDATGKVTVTAVRGVTVRGGWSSSTRGSKPRPPKPLKPGGQVTRAAQLHQLNHHLGGGLTPGVYELHVELYTKAQLGLEKNLTSNKVRFQIR